MSKIPEKVRLETVQTIPDADFRQQLSDWLGGKEISKNLQTRLRKELFETFNKTNLGRQLAQKHKHTQRIVLSPLVLAINQLVAEFLYEQNCHFTLSVFTSEVPYNAVLPDFEKVEKFRFNRKELQEIYEAMGFVDSDLMDCLPNVTEQYRSNETQNDSLLYCLFKEMLKRKKRSLESVKLGSPNKSQSTIGGLMKTKQSKGLRRHLKRYLKLLSLRERSQPFSEAELSKTSPEKSDFIKIVNQNLEKISQNIQFLSKKSRRNGNLSLIVRKFDRLIQKLDNCDRKLEAIVGQGSIRQESREQNITGHSSEPESYSEFVQRVKLSKNGQKFMARLQKSIEKSMEREREQTKRNHEEQLRSEKFRIKTRYRQKLLVKLAEQIDDSCQSKPEPKKIIEIPVIEFNKIDKPPEIDTEFQKQLAEIEFESEQLEKSVWKCLTNRNEEMERRIDEIFDKSKDKRILSQFNRLPIIAPIEPSKIPIIMDNLQENPIKDSEDQLDENSSDYQNPFREYLNQNTFTIKTDSIRKKVRDESVVASEILSSITTRKELQSNEVLNERPKLDPSNRIDATVIPSATMPVPIDTDDVGNKYRGREESPVNINLTLSSISDSSVDGSNIRSIVSTGKGDGSDKSSSSDWK